MLRKLGESKHLRQLHHVFDISQSWDRHLTRSLMCLPPSLKCFHRASGGSVWCTLHCINYCVFPHHVFSTKCPVADMRESMFPPCVTSRLSRSTMGARISGAAVWTAWGHVVCRHSSVVIKAASFWLLKWKIWASRGDYLRAAPLLSYMVSCVLQRGLNPILRSHLIK